MLSVSTPSTSLSIPSPISASIWRFASGGYPSDSNIVLAANARSGAVSTRVPSRSNAMARTRSRRLGMRFLHCACDGVLHLRDRAFVIIRAEDRRARDERVRTGTGNRCDVLEFHATVHFE